MSSNRIVSWFSCGAASAVATKLALTKSPVVIAYCEVMEEHPDNMRFLKDCEEWFDQEIVILGNDKYDRSIYEVFRKTRYLCGPGRAKCTGELKAQVRREFERPTDTHIMGYTVEEIDRLDAFLDANNIDAVAPLIDAGLTKEDCLAIVERAGIVLPAMYLLGYNNNNCRGCVKAVSPRYWKKIEVDFPEYHKKMNQAEVSLGRAVCKINMISVKKKYPEIYKSLGSPDIPAEGSIYWRPQLHELPDDIEPMDDTPDAQCGIFCQLTEQVIGG